VDNEILLNTYREVVDRVSGFEEPMEKIYEAALGKFSIYSALYNVLVETAEKEKERQQKEKEEAKAKREKQKKADEDFWESLEALYCRNQ
jgi:ATPase subunit of ABC transporter with duplicated ATPase domains